MIRTERFKKLESSKKKSNQIKNQIRKLTVDTILFGSPFPIQNYIWAVYAGDRVVFGQVMMRATVDCLIIVWRIEGKEKNG